MGVFKRWRKSEDGSRAAFWYIRYAVNRKIKWESVGKVGVVTKDVARTRLEERKRQVKLGQLDMIGARIPTLSEFAAEYLAYIRDVKQIRSHVRSRHALVHFTRLYRNKKLSKITIEDIDIYKRRRFEDNAKPGTIARELAVVRNMFYQARKWHKFFGENPVSQSGMPEVHNQIEQILSPEEEERLLKVSPPYLRNIIITALNTGMRKMEILSLKWDYIDLENKVITIPQANTKSKKTRRIPVSSALRKTLLEQKLRSGGSEFVFPSTRSKSGHLSFLDRAFAAACKSAEIQGFRFHDLRHTAATRIIESRKGISLDAVKKLLGHSTIKITERYSHPESSIEEAVEILANFTTNYSQNYSQQKSEE
ncbi:MAG: tyrosine-type recombinase/integrase [Ignavibacteriales bacterium]